jgi:hypothetical protein
MSKETNRLSISPLGQEQYEIVDGRTIRHLSCDDDNGVHVVLMDGKGIEYLADSAEWAKVKHLSIYTD